MLMMKIFIAATVAAFSGVSATTSSPQRRRTLQNKHQSIKQQIVEEYDPYMGLDPSPETGAGGGGGAKNRNLLSMSMDTSVEPTIPPDNIIDHDTTNAPQCSSTLMFEHPACKTCLYACGQVTTKSCAFGAPGTCTFDCASFGDSFVEKQYCVVPSDDSEMNVSTDTKSSASIYKTDTLGVMMVGLASVGYMLLL